MTDRRDVVRYAIEFTKRGYACYPVNIELDSNGAKIPQFKWTPESPGWKNGAYPTDPEEIERHWTGYGGLAINTERSGVVAVDIDKKGSVDGHQALEDAQIVLPATPFSVASWSGGEHLYYRVGDIPVGTSAGVLARGVDIRATGGVIFAPPTPVGNRVYRVATASVAYVSDLPVFPERLARDLAAVQKRPHVNSAPAIRRELVSHEIEYHTQRRKDALAVISSAGDGDRRAAVARYGAIVLGVADLLREDSEESVKLIQEAYEQSGGVEWDKHDRLIADLSKYVRENPYELTPIPAQVALPEGVREDQREDYMTVKDRKVLNLIADREIKAEEMERQAALLSLGAPQNLAEIMANPPDTPLWLVDDLLHSEKLRGLVIGQAKAGKSTFVQTLMSCLTSGDSFLARYPVRRTVRVAYVDLELGTRLAHDWLAPLPRLKHDQVEYYDRVGQGHKLDCRAPGLRRRWAQELADLGVDVMVIDPISPVLSALGMSEDSSEVRALLDSFDELANMAGMSGVIVCHHAGHSNAERGRGSSAFNDWLTARMSIVLQNDRTDLPRKFSTMGRGIAPVSGELVRDMTTGALTLEYPDDPLELDPFVSYRKWPLSMQRACEITGESESSTRRKLRRYGWSSGNTTGGRGKQSEWVYTGTDPEDDPFSGL